MFRKPGVRWRRAWAREEGLSTLEWIGLTAVVLVFITAALYFAQSSGWPQLMNTVSDRMDCQVQVWDQGGTCGGGRDGSSFGGGLGFSGIPGNLGNPSIISPATGVPSLFSGLGNRKSVDEKYPVDYLLEEMKKSGGKSMEWAELIKENDVRITWVSEEEMNKFDGCEKFCFGLYVLGRNEIFLNRDGVKWWHGKKVLMATLAHEATHVKQAVDNGELADRGVIDLNRSKTIDDYVASELEESAEQKGKFSPEEIRKAVIIDVNEAVEKELEAKNAEAEAYRSTLTPWGKLLYDLGLDVAGLYPTTAEERYDKYKIFYQKWIDKNGYDIILPPKYTDLQKMLQGDNP